ncbi:pectinesterase 10 [Canna indica]|uniref:pectinesterase n=1 Tax=Canna indica TaxID=4628 RepID=A0AAQ3KPB2_9LILI|nr:pectinesterase 10 [Canna indica]
MKMILKLLFFSLNFPCVILLVNGGIQVTKTITVNINGGADFKSIQEAINSIPDQNQNWIKVSIAPGVYSEKVNIPKEKEYILLQGSGAHTTSIEWGDYNGDPSGHGTTTSATFTASANNFVAADIFFKNTHSGVPKISQAVAALIDGDKSALYRCSFSSIQDTLADSAGRHYYNSCYIEGAFDFIFGNAQSIFEKCTISTVNKVPGLSLTGFLTAHGRERSDQTTGFVFKYCVVTGSEKAYLGRAWRVYSRVIFYKTDMSDIVVPEGWNAWHATGQEQSVTYVESGCTGSGSNQTKRVGWLKKLSDAELWPLIDMSFIDTEGWLKAQPL